MVNRRSPKNLWFNFRKGQRFLFTPKSHTVYGVHHGAGGGAIHGGEAAENVKQTDRLHLCVIWGFRHDVDEICCLLGCYAVGVVIPHRSFGKKLSVSASKVKKSRRLSWSLKLWPIGCPETLVRNYHSRLCIMPEERGSQYHLVLRLRMSRDAQTPTCMSSWNTQGQI